MHYMHEIGMERRENGMYPNRNMGKHHQGEMDEIEVVLRRFGDEQSTLLDRFERLSFEVQLNQAILGRSLSEPSHIASRCHHQAQACAAAPLLAPPPLVSQVSQGRRRRRGLGFQRILKKLFQPILGRKGPRKEVSPDPKDPRSWNKFSKSLRY